MQFLLLLLFLVESQRVPWIKNLRSHLRLSNVKPGIGQKIDLNAPPAAGCCQNARLLVEQNELKAEPNRRSITGPVERVE